LREGHGLQSQQTRCEQFAKVKGYEVVESFHDEGVSGGLIERPGMQSLLSFLNGNKGKNITVIIDDISRLARSLEAHIQLRMAISNAGGILESPSIEFGEDSDSKLVENLLASVSQHARQKNAEQVTNRMKARAYNGYWISSPVPGYRYEKVEGHGKLLVRDEPKASIVQEVLEGFARGRFETQMEVKRFLDAQPDWPKGRSGEVHYSRIYELLTRPLYAGVIHLPKWGIEYKEGKHDPLVSYADWQKIQQRLQEAPTAPIRKDLNEGFPLRGFIQCGCCSRPMTSCYSKGRSKTYAYFMCYHKPCRLYGKSVRQEKLESEFSEILNTLSPSRPLFSMAVDIFKDIWDKRVFESRDKQKYIDRELQKVEKKIEQVLERLIETDSAALMQTYCNPPRK